MPSPNWSLALAELIYYVLSLLPIFYCFWKHRKYGLTGWIFLFVFVVLQLIGAILTLSAGEEGTPSKTATLVTSIGLSPLLLAIAGILSEWTKLSGGDILKTKRSRSIRIACLVVYHLLVAAGVAIYAIGATNALKPDGSNGGSTEWKIGVIILLISWVVLCLAFGFLMWRIGTATTPAAYFWQFPTSLVLIGLRIIYQTIATFNQDRGEYNAVTGSIALKVVFEFLPGALMLAAMVIAGVMSLKLVRTAEVKESQYARRDQGELGSVAWS